MTRDQKIVAIGASSGIAFMIAAVAALSAVLPVDPTLGDLASRLGRTLQAGAFSAIPLFAAIITVANGRFLSEAIDPTLQREGKAMLIDGRVVDNTLQQYVLFLVASLALSVELSPEWMTVIPAAAAVFVVSRFAFWIGYRIHPLYRAFGMAATSYLNLGLLLAALWLALT